MRAPFDIVLNICSLHPLRLLRAACHEFYVRDANGEHVQANLPRPLNPRLLGKLHLPRVPVKGQVQAQGERVP